MSISCEIQKMRLHFLNFTTYKHFLTFIIIIIHMFWVIIFTHKISNYPYNKIAQWKQIQNTYNTRGIPNELLIIPPWYRIWVHAVCCLLYFWFTNYNTHFQPYAKSIRVSLQCLMYSSGAVRVRIEFPNVLW